MKVPERVHMPGKWWEKIPLSKDTTEAQAQIQEKLQYWTPFAPDKCKARVARIHEYLARREKMAQANDQPIMTAVKDKATKRDKRREERARNVARIEGTIEKELMERLKKGVYGEMYNINQKVFDAAITRHGKHEALTEEPQEEYEQMREFYELYSSAAEESEVDLEDTILTDTKNTAAPSTPAPTRKKPRMNVQIEYEQEDGPVKQLVRK